MSRDDWTDTAIDQLRALWPTGLSTTAIGREIGVSKNAVIGKARRLGLAGRGSPIQRSKSGEPRSCTRKTVLKLTGIMPMTPVEPSGSRPLPPTLPNKHSTTRPETTPDSPGRREPAKVGKTACCWPIGEPTKPGFHFCEAPVIAGKPYCEVHCRTAYQKARVSRDQHAD